MLKGAVGKGRGGWAILFPLFCLKNGEKEKRKREERRKRKEKRERRERGNEKREKEILIFSFIFEYFHTRISHKLE